jgi:UDP-N-acetylglucosamine 2-epimerase
VQSVDLCRAMWENNEPLAKVPDYQDENVSVKVVKIIQSYTKIINKVVWGK